MIKFALIGCDRILRMSRKEFSFLIKEIDKNQTEKIILIY